MGPMGQHVDFSPKIHDLVIRNWIAFFNGILYHFVVKFVLLQIDQKREATDILRILHKSLSKCSK